MTEKTPISERLNQLSNHEIPRYYGLTPNMRERVLFRGTTDGSDKEYKKKAFARVQALPARIQDLIDDIHILSTGGIGGPDYLSRDVFEQDIDEEYSIVGEDKNSEGSGDRIPSEFSDIQGNTFGGSELESEVRKSITDEERRNFSVQAGYLIGDAVEALEPLFNKDFNRDAFLWGQILAFTQSRMLPSKKHRRRGVDMIHNVEEWADKHDEQIGEQAYLNALEMKTKDEAVVLAEKYLSRQGLPQSAAQYVEEQITPRFEIRDGELEPIIEEQVETIMSSLVDDDRFEAIIDLVEDLQSDMGVNDTHSIFAVGPPGITIEEPLEELWKSFRQDVDNSFTEELEDGWETDRSKTGIMRNKKTEAYRQVSVEESIKEEANTNGERSAQPILRETGDKADFKITPYGALLMYCYFENVAGAKWIYGILRDDAPLSTAEIELVEAALSTGTEG